MNYLVDFLKLYRKNLEYLRLLAFTLEDRYGLNIYNVYDIEEVDRLISIFSNNNKGEKNVKRRKK